MCEITKFPHVSILDMHTSLLRSRSLVLRNEYVLIKECDFQLSKNKDNSVIKIELLTYLVLSGAFPNEK